MQCRETQTAKLEAPDRTTPDEKRRSCQYISTGRRVAASKIMQVNDAPHLSHQTTQSDCGYNPHVEMTA